MDEQTIQTIVANAELIASNLDTAPDLWRDQLPNIRNTITSLDLSDTIPGEASRRWQILIINVFQRVAFADADIDAVQDVADWCLRQALSMLQIYPDDVDILTLIGRNWLLRAQKSLASISRAESESSSSDPGQSEQQNVTRRASVGTEELLNEADYVEARGLLLPATEYLERAVNAAAQQGLATGPLLATAAEAFMNLGNVTSTRLNDRYFQQALNYLRVAAGLSDYTLSPTLEQYLDEWGPLYPNV